MNNKKKALLKLSIIICIIAIGGTIGYYFAYYRPNKTELIRISKEFVEKRPTYDAIPEELRKEEFFSDKVQNYINNVRNELSSFYSQSGKLESEIEFLSEYYKEVLEEDDMLISVESKVYKINRSRLSMRDATIMVSTEVTETKELYGSRTVNQTYTINYVKEDGKWKIVSNESTPAME